MNAGHLNASVLFINKTRLPFIVSNEDADWLSKLTFHLTWKGYVATNIKQADGSFKAVHLHRLLMRPEDGLVVDHINGSKLDNRRENLRVVSNSDNCAAARQPQKSLSGIRGVHRHRNGWCVVYRGEYLGKYDTKEEAHKIWLEHIQAVNPALLATIEAE
jgi:hypothetical protein